MNKQTVIESLENAVKMHKAQMQKIESAMEGKKVQNPTPIKKMECDCGKWFYSNETHMKEILGEQLFNKLDNYHERWHIDYEKIHGILFQEKAKGFLSKVLKSHKIDEMSMDKAKFYQVDLNQTTQELLQISSSAIRRVKAMSDSKFHD